MKNLLPSQPLRVLAGKLAGTIILALTLANCSTGTVDSAGPTPPATSYSGTLTSVTLTTSDPSINPTGTTTIVAAVTFSISVTEDGTLSGVVSISDNRTNCFSGGPISGTVTGASITATITDSIAGTVSFSGTVTPTDLYGTYSSTGNITSETETGDSMEERTVYSGCPPHTGTIDTSA